MGGRPEILLERILSGGNVQQDSGDGSTTDVSHDSHSCEEPTSEEPPPSLQLRVIKVEQIPILEEPETHLQVKEEREDRCISPDVEADASNSAQAKHLKSEPSASCELLPSPGAPTESLSDGSLSPRHSVEVFVELEQPPREEKSCHICGKSFKKDSYLIRHVNKSHKGRRAFRCLLCDKEFDQRFQLVLHVRSHTGDKPFSCDYCSKTFVQNSSRLAHMRVHTGEKPYFCAKCGRSFATSNHFKFCKMHSEGKVTLEEREDADQKEEKAFKCFQCNKEFDKNHQLVRHVRVHTGEKPFSCDFCGKTFTQNSNRVVHMRQHTGEKPYFCDKCGKRFASSHHLKLCTGRQPRGSDKLFRCTICGRTFHTDSNLKVHLEAHESWQRHISRKLQGHKLEERKIKARSSRAAGGAAQTNPARFKVDSSCRHPPVCCREWIPLFKISAPSLATFLHFFFPEMSVPQLLELVVTERLSAAAKEICALVSKTLKEFQDEATRSKTEVLRLRKQIEQMAALKPRVVIIRPEAQSVTQKPPQQPPTVERTKTPVHQQVKEEPTDQCLTSEPEADSPEDVKVLLCESEDQKSGQQPPAFSSITVTLNDDDEWIESDISGPSSCGPSDASFSERERAQQDDFTCRLCEKKFQKNCDLCRHMDKIHPGQKAHKCSDCGRQFSRRDHMAEHLRIHTGEKPHKCSLCGMSFTQRSALSVHLRRHTGEKPYFCKNCNKAVSYTRHLKTCGITNSKRKKPFCCSVCGKMFHAASINTNGEGCREMMENEAAALTDEPSQTVPVHEAFGSS
ncbi:zinc finger protein 572-like [Stegastes partitus]|uniref:Zinc finger protein 572-like n=1 Tax=Stegastes partitus TaxID=144197 RepID=A0A9Y4U3T0_9TELE|nr:PREDICTED: zinc finger protein 572-like [Stegastes partitus]